MEYSPVPEKIKICFHFIVFQSRFITTKAVTATSAVELKICLQVCLCERAQEDVSATALGMPEWSHRYPK